MSILCFFSVEDKQFSIYCNSFIALSTMNFQTDKNNHEKIGSLIIPKLKALDDRERDVLERDAL